jgi:hypothetical protein
VNRMARSRWLSWLALDASSGKLARSGLSLGAADHKLRSMTEPGSPLRFAAAAIAGVSTWAAIAWLGNLLFPIPRGAYVFLLILAVTILILGKLLPSSGFGWGSVSIGLGMLAATAFVLGVMKTSIVPLIVGLVILVLAFTPALFVFTVVKGEKRVAPEANE